MAKAIPDGYHAVTPYISCSDAARAIRFYQEALGAKELYRLPMPNGKIGHAELQIGDSRLMLADEAPEWGNRSAKSFGGTPVTLCIYTENVDALADRFVKAGGKVVRPLARRSVSWNATGRCAPALRANDALVLSLGAPPQPPNPLPRIAGARSHVQRSKSRDRALENQFYGDRSGQFEDPEGYKWRLMQHVEDVSPDEIQRRMAKMG